MNLYFSPNGKKMTSDPQFYIDSYDLPSLINYLQTSEDIDWKKLMICIGENNFTEGMEYAINVCPRAILIPLLDSLVRQAIIFYNKRLCKLYVSFGLNNPSLYRMILGDRYDYPDKTILNNIIHIFKESTGSFFEKDLLKNMIESFVTYEKTEDKIRAGFCTNFDLPLDPVHLGHVIEENHIDLINSFSDIIKSDKGSNLYYAVKSGSIDLVNMFIGDQPYSMGIEIESAIERDDDKMIDYLLEKTGPVHIFHWEYYVMEPAIRKNRIDLVKMCLAKGCIVKRDHIDKLVGWSQSSDQMFDLVMSNTTLGIGESWLKFAINTSNRYLIEKYITCDTPLNIIRKAIANCSSSFIEYLLDLPSFKDLNINALLSIAIELESDLSIIKLFLSRGAVLSRWMEFHIVRSNIEIGTFFSKDIKWRDEFDIVLENFIRDRSWPEIYFMLYLGAKNWDVYIRMAEESNMEEVIIKFFERCKKGEIDVETLFYP